MSFRRCFGPTRRSHTDTEKEIQEYVGLPRWQPDIGYYYPADKVNAGIAMLIGTLAATKKDG